MLSTVKNNQLIQKAYLMLMEHIVMNVFPLISMILILKNAYIIANKTNSFMKMLGIALFVKLIIVNNVQMIFNLARHAKVTFTYLIKNAQIIAHKGILLTHK